MFSKEDTIVSSNLKYDIIIFIISSGIIIVSEELSILNIVRVSVELCIFIDV